MKKSPAKKLNEEKMQEYKKEFAAQGGRANVAKHGEKHMAEIGKKGLKKRWGTKRKNKIIELLFDH